MCQALFEIYQEDLMKMAMDMEKAIAEVTPRLKVEIKKQIETEMKEQAEVKVKELVEIKASIIKIKYVPYIFRKKYGKISLSHIKDDFYETNLSCHKR